MEKQAHEDAKYVHFPFHDCPYDKTVNMAKSYEIRGRKRVAVISTTYIYEE